MVNREFKSRRNKLLKNLDENSIVIIFSAEELDPNLPYRQNSDFYYLTGFIEPEAVAVLDPKNTSKPYTIFSKANNPTQNLWMGEYAGQIGAKKSFGADLAYPIAEIDKILPKLLTGRRNIYYNIDFKGNFCSRIASWTNKNKRLSHNLIDLGKILHEMRLIKGKYELAAIQKAVDITQKGLLRAMKKCRPNMYEYELEAELLYEFNRNGAREMAFEPIVAGGTNACTLHYSKNNQKLAFGDLVLIDAGTKFEQYSADISRTFPVSGKFTKKQRLIYEIVLNAQDEVIKKINRALAS